MNPGLIFYMHDGPTTFRFELAGDLAGAEVSKLAQAWQTACSTIGGKTLAVDVTFLKTVDEKGRDLLFRWYHSESAHFIATSASSRTLVESITGRPYAPIDPAVGPTFEPRFMAASMRAVLFALAFAGTMIFPANALSAEHDGSAVLERYAAALVEKSVLDTMPESVVVEASMPKLEKQARVEAVGRWTDGKKRYRFTSSEGDSFVRNEMIARYFAIEMESAPVATAITKSNYKFRFVGRRENISIFQITPRKKRLGMIEGELWIETETGLVTHLSGRMVKSPSILLRGIAISQEMEIRDGVTLARETHLHIDTRFTGIAELTIREHPASAEAADEVSENVTPKY